MMILIKKSKYEYINIHKIVKILIKTKYTSDIKTTLNCISFSEEKRSRATNLHLISL